MKYENLGFGDLLAGKAYDPTAQVEQARGCDRLGANGVVAVREPHQRKSRSSTSMVMAGAAELLAVGTASCMGGAHESSHERVLHDRVARE